MQISPREPGDVQPLQESIRRERRSEQADRYRVALLAIQQALTRSRGFVQRWAYAYRDGGLKALQAKPRGGGTPKLSEAQAWKFRQRMLADPTDADGGRCSLRG